MRRPAALLLAVALLASVAAPAAAGDLDDPTASPAPEVSPSVEPSLDPLPSPDQDPSAEPSASAEPELTPAPVAEPDPAAAEPEPAAEADSADPAGRWIVIYRNGTDAARVAKGQATRMGFRTERTFTHALRGFSAALSARQVRQLRSDPSVAAVVPDERIEIQAQAYPTGINRVGARTSVASDINGSDDERVDADVAIVDTGIRAVADLNVAGGYNCSTSDRAAWRDYHGHGTHVAGTVGAIDNDLGVVGVAPGVRLWAVKILNDSGSGLLSWYVCGLDWIAAQRDPNDSSMPMFESVNMSVAKSGKDDGACGTKNSDILHAAICRLVASGVTVVAAAANDSANASTRVPAAYNEVITVSALADTDGKPGGLGGNRCFSWGSYDSDDTFANFSNYGGDVDLIAPGKCIWSTVPSGYQYMSGTSMAAPHVAGAAALVKETRPNFSPAEVKEALQYLGTSDWKTWTDPDSIHEKLLNVSKLGPRGTFSVAFGTSSPTAEAGGTARIPVKVTRSTTSFERVRFSASGLPSGFTASFSPSSVYGFGSQSTSMLLSVPASAALGTYSISVTADEHGVSHKATVTVRVTEDNPTAHAPGSDAWRPGTLNTTTIPARVSWPAATDPSSGIAGYELQASRNGSAWSPTVTYGPSVLAVGSTHVIGDSYRYRIRARDDVGHWSAWVTGAATVGSVTQEISSAIAWRGTWTRYAYANASGGTARYASASGASAKLTFTGSGVAVVGPMSPSKGSARIYIDGVYKGAYWFRSSTSRNRQVIWSGVTSAGTHTIEVRAVGNGRIDVDAFVIFR
ncbi:MAG TPA: S8 family serine peptidase [Candidatus Limnocylindrales bacterium]|nr:S8 family serine peptidase [Candidatus Limnocylindrales bacterium]